MLSKKEDKTYRKIQGALLKACAGHIEEGHFVFFNLADEKFYALSEDAREEICLQINGNEFPVKDLPVQMRYELAQQLLQMHQQALHGWAQAAANEERRERETGLVIPQGAAAGHPMSRGVR